TPITGTPCRPSVRATARPFTFLARTTAGTCGVRRDKAIHLSARAHAGNGPAPKAPPDRPMPVRRPRRVARAAAAAGPRAPRARVRPSDSRAPPGSRSLRLGRGRAARRPRTGMDAFDFDAAFDADYLHFHEPWVAPRSDAEAALIEGLLGLRPGERVLDLA